jgi:hypothetical protein
MNGVTLIVLINVLGTLIYAQSAVPQPSFEVATIKPNDGSQPGQGIGINASGTFTARNVTVRKLIMEAYDLREVQVAGGPAWMDTDRTGGICDRRFDGRSYGGFVAGGICGDAAECH